MKSVTALSDIIKYLFECYPLIQPFEIHKLAVEIQRNEILSAAFNLEHDDVSVSSLLYCMHHSFADCATHLQNIEASLIGIDEALQDTAEYLSNADGAIR